MGQLIMAWLIIVSVVFGVCVGVIVYGRMHPSKKGAAFRKTDREVEQMEARIKDNKLQGKLEKLDRQRAESLCLANVDPGVSVPESEIGMIPAQDTVDIAAAINQEAQSTSAASSPSRRVPQQDDDDVKPPKDCLSSSTKPAGKLLVPPIAALRRGNSPAVSPGASPRADTAPAVMANSPAPSSSRSARSPRPFQFSARTPRSEADLAFEEAVGNKQYFSIETTQLVEVMGLSGMALLEMEASSGISGIRLVYALPCIAAQAWFLQLALLYYMARRCCRLSGDGGLDGVPGEPPKDVPFVIIFAAIYLHF